MFSWTFVLTEVFHDILTQTCTELPRVGRSSCGSEEMLILVITEQLDVSFLTAAKLGAVYQLDTGLKPCLFAVTFTVWLVGERTEVGIFGFHALYVVESFKR